MPVISGTTPISAAAARTVSNPSTSWSWSVSQAAPAHGDGVAVELDIEPGELGDDPVVVDEGEQLLALRGGPARPVEEHELLLGPDAPLVGLERPVGDHRFQRVEVAQDMLDGRRWRSPRRPG
jgi:hypothetical protein